MASSGRFERPLRVVSGHANGPAVAGEAAPLDLEINQTN